MEKIRRDINGICRLCLCNDENILFPATKFTDSTLTVDDIERFTGIRVIAKGNTPHALCIDCKNKLQKINAYRLFCLSNDVKFRKLFPVAVGDKAEATASSAKPQFANDRSGSTSPSDNIDECNMINIATEDKIEIAEIEGNSNDETEKSLQTTRSFVDMHELSYDSIEYADDDTSIEPSNTTFAQATQYSDKWERQFLITPINDTTAEASNTVVKPVKELCTLCGKLVTSADIHMQTHATELNFTCEFCQKKYRTKTYLTQHVQAVHRKRILRTCESCNRGFRYLDSYEAHMRAKHNFGVPFECKICNLKFRHRGGLRNHKNQKHNIASNCECSICGMTFQDKKGLKDHGRVHSDEQPYACKYCPKRFKGPTARKTHELVHEGVKFPCTLCDKVYAYKTLLNAHMRKAHVTEDTASSDS